MLAAERRLAADAVFVDVGANIGTHTVYALKTGRFARAVAFEPEPRNARLLAMNIEANGFSNAVTIVPKAAGEAAATAVLHLHPRNKGAHAIGAPPSDDGRERLDVPVVRVEDALGELGLSAERLGLIWIDVEGHEPQVMRGLGALARRSRADRLRIRAAALRRGGQARARAICWPPTTRPCTASTAHRITALPIARARDDAGHGRHLVF